VHSAFVYGCAAAPGASPFSEVGSGSTGVVVRGNSFARAERGVVVGPGLPADAVDSDEKLHQG
jgi:hypothetical protein